MENTAKQTAFDEGYEAYSKVIGQDEDVVHARTPAPKGATTTYCGVTGGRLLFSEDQANLAFDPALDKFPAPDEG